MRRRVDLISLAVAAGASGVIAIQNWMAMVGFGWGLIHGAVFQSALAFVPAGVGLAIVWTAYWVAVKRAGWSGPAVVGLCAAATIVLNELLLPETPLEWWRAHKAVQAVEIRNISDEPLLSALGNPIGVRLNYDVAFPRKTRASVSATARHESIPLGLNLARGSTTIVPKTTQVEDGVYHLFQPGVVYRITQARMPAFLIYDEGTGTVCLDVSAYDDRLTEAQVVTVLSNARHLRYRTQIRISSPMAGSDKWVHYETSNEYDLEAMYRTIGAEGGQLCHGRGRWRAP